MSAPLKINRRYSDKVIDSAIIFWEFSLETKDSKEKYLRELEWKCYTDDIIDMQRLLEFMDSDLFMAYGAFNCEKLIGAVMVVQNGDDIPEIILVSVLEQYRRKHYAGIMIEHVMNVLSPKRVLNR